MSIIKRNTLASYINDCVLGSYFQLPIWIVYQSQFLSYTQIATFASLAILTEVFMQIPTGAFADIFGRRHSLALGNLFMAIPLFLLAIFPTPGIMPIYAIMWGSGRAFCMGTSKPILYETLTKYAFTAQYQKILSNSLICFQLSAAISTILGGYLYQIKPNLPYIVSGIVSLLGVFTAYLFIEDRDHSNFHLSHFVATIKGGIVAISDTSYMLRLTLLFCLTLGIAQAAQQQLIQPYMLELGMGDIARSWAAMIIKISIAFLGAKVISMSKIITHRYFLLLIPVIMILAFIPASFVTIPFAYLTFTLIAFNSGNIELFFSNEIQAHINSKTRSTSISLLRMFASIVGALTMYCSSVVVTHASVGTYFSYLGYFALFVILPLAYLQSSHKHKTTQLDTTLRASQLQ